MNFNLPYELILLGGKHEFQENDPAEEIFKLLSMDEASVLLKEKCMKDMWKYLPIKVDDNFGDYLKTCVKNFISESEDYSLETRQLLVLIQGVTFLHLFVQQNWTGPPLLINSKELLEPLLSAPFSAFYNNSLDFETNLNDVVFTSLFEESCMLKIKCPEYLWIASLLLCSCNRLLNLCMSAFWWGLRCTFIHQQTLDDRSPHLAEVARTFIDHGVTVEPLMTDEKFRDLQIQFHLEVAPILAYYYRMSDSKEHLNKAQKLSGLSLSMSGALGKRTYYQQEDKSQLILVVSRQQEVSMEMPVDINLDLLDLPKDLKLDDNVRMNSIVYKDRSDANEVDLLPVEQAVLLNLFYHMRRSNAFDKLIDEELILYLTTVLNQPKNWAVQTMALYWRSILESNNKRTIERSMLQLQVLVDDFNNAKPIVKQRKNLFYCVGFLPIWQIENKLADIYREMGAIKSALDVYLKLERWNDIIQCYYLLRQKQKAEDIIREQLRIKETPSMWCFLGDITEDAEHYLKAWELSEYRSARAQKGLGYLLFNKKQYLESIPHFKKSLELNHLQVELWSTLAYAAMQMEDWELTAEAYRKCLNLEPDNFLAWNNLSNAYIKLNQKPRAWKTLQEALRCNYDDWRIWENYLLVSTDCGAFDEVINAYHRILDLKEKHTDVEVLSILVKAISEDLPDNSGNSARCYLSNALKLFGRLTSQVTNDSKLWMLYADLTASSEAETVQQDKVVQYLQRAYRCATFHDGWEKDDTKRHYVVDIALKLVEACMKLSEITTDNQTAQFLTSGKLVLKGIISKLKRQNNSLLEASVEIEGHITTLEEKLNAVENCNCKR